MQKSTIDILGQHSNICREKNEELGKEFGRIFTKLNTILVKNDEGLVDIGEGRV